MRRATNPDMGISHAIRLLLACAVLLAWTAGARAACVVRLRAETPLEVIGGTILAPVMVNGIAGRFILDTGAQRSVVTPAAVQRLGLALDEWVGTTMRGVGGIERRRNANPRSLTLAGVALERRTVTRDTSLTVGTLPQAALGGQAIDGLLGRDFLSLFDLVLDISARRLALYEVQGCSGRFLPWSGPYAAVPVENPAESALVVPVQLDGVRLRALLDSGASASLVAAPGMARLGLTAERLARDPADQVSGLGPHVLTMRQHRFGALKVGDETISAPVLWVGEVRVLPIVDMLLGADWLAGKRVWISYATRQVFIAG